MALSAGVANHDEIVKWADKLLDVVEYDDQLAEISVSGKRSQLEMISKLNVVGAKSDPFEAMRFTLQRIHSELTVSTDRIRSFAMFLEFFAVDHINDLPEEFRFMYGADDMMSLAQEGVYGTMDQATSDLLAELARYADFHNNPRHRTSRCG